MAGLLSRAGHGLARTPDEADFIIVNTCGFIEDAKKESIEAIFEMLDYKADHRKVVVTGCLTQRYADEMAEELPEVDAFLGVNDYERLPDLLAELEGAVKARGVGMTEQDSVIPGSDPGSIGLDSARVFASQDVGILTGDRLALDPRYSSYLKVGEGCSNACTYCIIPKIRGPYRSVPMDTLIEEARKLATEGAKELVLIAQDVTYYGTDLRRGDSGSGAGMTSRTTGMTEPVSDLPELLRRLCHEEGLEEIRWIRLLYCYEERITDELIRVMAQEEKICNYIDIPIQHVADSVLSRMNRHSTKASIQSTIAKLRAAMPDISIRTTIITGFPGETDEEFSQLREFVQETRLDRLGVFAYSREEGTVAFDMPDQVPEEVAIQRRDELMRLQIDISLEKNEEEIGKVLDVIIDDIEDEYYLGRTRKDAPEIDNAVIITAVGALNPELIGEILKVKITDAMDYDLVGELI
jgi:ribosomal protein S12 methylthiotransferase